MDGFVQKYESDTDEKKSLKFAAPVHETFVKQLALHALLSRPGSLHKLP
jgi:hypothetical protein